METSPEPGTPSIPPDRQADRAMPNGIRFARGISIFLIAFTVFFLVQSAVFIGACVEATPELQGLSWDEVIQDPLLPSTMKELATNGDAVSMASFWSGLSALLVLLVLVVLWKRSGWWDFMGINTPSVISLLKWMGIFALLAAGMEVLARIFPVFTTDFMEKVVSTADDRMMLYLGIGMLPALFEEALLRGLLLGSLRHITEEHMSVAITAGVFAVMHMQYEPMIMLLVLAMGVVLGYARTRSGSLLVPIVLHMLNNVLSISFPTE